MSLLAAVFCASWVGNTVAQARGRGRVEQATNEVQVGRSERPAGRSARRTARGAARGTGGTAGVAGVAGTARAMSGCFRAGGRSGGDRATIPGSDSARLASRGAYVVSSIPPSLLFGWRHSCWLFRWRAHPRAKLVDVWRAGGADPSPATFAKVCRLMTRHIRSGCLNHCDVTAGRAARQGACSDDAARKDWSP